MKPILTAGALLAALSLSACVMDDAGSTPATPSVPDVQQVETARPLAGWRPVTYRCDGAQVLQAQFSPAGDKVAIEQMGERVMLNQIPSASGARYQAASKHYAYQLDTKGDTATLYGEKDRVVLGNCTAR